MTQGESGMANALGWLTYATTWIMTIINYNAILTGALTVVTIVWTVFKALNEYHKYKNRGKNLEKD